MLARVAAKLLPNRQALVACFLRQDEHDQLPGPPVTLTRHRARIINKLAGSPSQWPGQKPRAYASADGAPKTEALGRGAHGQQTTVSSSHVQV